MKITIGYENISNNNVYLNAIEQEALGIQS